MNDWYILLISVVVLAIQHFFSTRDSLYWGSFLPIVFLILTIYSQISGMLDYSFIMLIIVVIAGELFLIETWVIGRKSVAKKREKELAKMKAIDI